MFMNANELPGLPSDISLKFNKVNVEFYNSREESGYFYCMLHILGFTDEDENPLSLSFYDSLSSRFSERDEYSERYNEKEYDPEEDSWVNASEYEPEMELKDDPFEEYLVPYNDHNLDSLPKAVTCYFEEKTEMGQRILLLHMKIQGTPFLGYVFIEDELYTITK